MDRLGPRKVMMVGTSIMTIGFLALSWVSNVVPWSCERLLMYVRVSQCTELWHFFLCQSLFISSGIALM